MKVALTVNDFLRRAELVYADRIGVVDEPDQPAPSWGEMTWAQVAERARAQAAGLDALGIAPGERVAVVNQNSARLFTSFSASAAAGTSSSPSTSAWPRRRSPTSWSTRAPGCSSSIPSSTARLSGIEAEHRFVIGAESDEALYRFDLEPAPWEADEDATASINYTSGTTARPKGVQLTHRNIWINAATFGWQIGVDDRDVYLHTLPQFHCNGWGMPYAVTGMGGARHHPQGRRRRDPPPHRAPRRDAALRTPAVVAMILDAVVLGGVPAPSRARAPSAWSWPVRLPRRGRSSQWQTELAAWSSSHSTV